MKIRFATTADSSALLRIYAQYIATPVTFEYVPPTEKEFAERIAGMAAFYPYLAAEGDGGIVGYACAHRHMERAAYQWNAELSVYLDRNFTGRGLGTRLYRILIEMLRLQGVRNVYGGVTSPNPGSEALHESMGFLPIGTCHNAGYKDGRWRDVTWFEKQIAAYDDNPRPVVSIHAIPAEKLRAILADGE